MPDKKVASASDIYEVYLGTFNDNKFTWYSVSKHKDLVEAYKAYKKYVNTQLKYTDEELKKVWDTGRLDVELRQGNKLLNWVGIYSRKVTELSKADEKDAEEAKTKKKDDKSKKDSFPYPELVDLKEGKVDEVKLSSRGGSVEFIIKKNSDGSYSYGMKTKDGFIPSMDELSYHEILLVYKELLNNITDK